MDEFLDQGGNPGQSGGDTGVPGGAGQGGGFDFSSFFKNLLSTGGGESGSFSLLTQLLKGLMSQGGKAPQQQQMPATPQGQQTTQPSGGNPLAALAMQQQAPTGKSLYNSSALDPSTMSALGLSEKAGSSYGGSYSPFFNQQLSGLGF